MKTTLAYGKNFHFYQEGFNNNFVYLELEDAPYDAGYRRVMVAIPIDVWEVIRSLGCVRLDLINASDEELLESVQRKVIRRISEYERVFSTDSEKAALLRFEDALIFGPADDNHEKQVEKGMQHYRMERERQRGIALRIAQHKIIDIDRELSEYEKQKQD